MEEARTKIAEYKHACMTIDEQLKTQFEIYGKAAIEVEVSSDDEVVMDARSRVQSKYAAVAEIEKSIRNIQQAKDASETAKEEISRIEQRLASIEFEKNSLYSRIGVITYEEYAAGEVGEEFSLLFTSITHQNAELSTIQKQLKENELRHVAASFFERMSLKLKRNKIKAEMERLESAREDLFRNAGKQICNSELIKLVKSKNAAVISADFKRLDQERDRMYALMESRKFDFNKSQEILNQSGIDSDVSKKVRELEKRLEKAKEELGTEYAEMGRLAIELDDYVAALKGIEHLDEVVAEIDRLTLEKKRIERRLARLEAKIKIKELESIIDVDHQKDQRVRSQIEALNEQLKELDQRIASNRKQIAALKKVLAEDPEDDGMTGEQA